MIFKSNRFLFSTLIFSSLITFCNAQKELPEKESLEAKLGPDFFREREDAQLRSLIMGEIGLNEDRARQVVSVIRELDLDKNETRQLLTAILDGRVKEVTELLKKHAGGASPTLTDAPSTQPCGDSPIEPGEYARKYPLLCAIHDGNIDSISSLLSKGADVNQKGAYGETPLHIALMQCISTMDSVINTQIMQMLIERGAEVNARNNTGLTPYFLLLLSYIQTCEMLRDNEDLPACKERETSEKFLKNAEVVAKFLEDHGADKNSVALHGETPQKYYRKYLLIPYIMRKYLRACFCTC